MGVKVSVDVTHAPCFSALYTSEHAPSFSALYTSEQHPYIT